MSLSKPVYTIIGIYFEQLFSHPIRTKSVTSGSIAALANYTSQKISRVQKIQKDSVFAYGLYGLIFGGSLPHYFYMMIERTFKADVKYRKFMLFLTERLIYAPLMQLLSIYVVSRFEGNSHGVAKKNLRKLYIPLLQLNWIYLSLPVLLNVYFVPPLLRVLFSNLIGFCWTVYVATHRRKHAETAKKQPCKDA